MELYVGLLIRILMKCNFNLWNAHAVNAVEDLHRKLEPFLNVILLKPVSVELLLNQAV